MMTQMLYGDIIVSFGSHIILFQFGTNFPLFMIFQIVPIVFTIVVSAVIENATFQRATRDSNALVTKYKQQYPSIEWEFAAKKWNQVVGYGSKGHRNTQLTFSIHLKLKYVPQLRHFFTCNTFFTS
jgi:hypothetical protein